MRTLATLAVVLVTFAASVRAADAACDAAEGEEPPDADVCEQELASFDDAFREDASLFDEVQLVVGSRLLQALRLRWSDDAYADVEWEYDEIELAPDEIDPDEIDELDPDEIDDEEDV